jgi:3-deoxy-D-manno-octulosonic-acid transferase
VIYYLYNLFLLLVSPLLCLLLARRLLAGKSRAGWAQRWGRLPEELACKRAPRLWFHAASVGEVMAATPILRACRERLPDHELVLSVITPGGYEVAAKMTDSLLRAAVYSPFDIPFAVRRALRTIQPDVFIDLETELWPNLLYHLKRAGARTALVNGRISDRSIGKYRRWHPFFAWTLSHFDRILAQSPRDAERLRLIGADAARVEVFGNAKFDQLSGRLEAGQVTALRRSLKLPEGAPIWVVGSTRLPEEERQVIQAYRKAQGALPDLALIHAPRHIERAEEVAALMREAGLAPARRTQLANTEGPVSVLILDTLGELANVYAVGDVAFVGNSLVPPGGGQNPLQPLAQGKPVLYGKYMANFRDIAAMAEVERVGFTVADADDLAARLVDLVRSPPERAAIADRALALIEANRGAADRYADAIVALATADGRDPVRRNRL